MFQPLATIIVAVTALTRPPSAECFLRPLVSASIHPQSIDRIRHVGNSGRLHGNIPTKLKRHDERESSQMTSSETSSLWGSPPYIALLTEPDACTSIERVEETIRAIDQATTDGGVNLVVLRVSDSPGDESALLKFALLKNIAELKRKRNNFVLVVNDDVDIVLRALSQNITVDGVHVKEYNSHLIPSVRSKLEHAVTCSFDSSGNAERKIVIGTSCHSVESAKKSYQLSPLGPDYLFVGTCYLTQSHPEKQSTNQLEGPTLPGRVKKELYQMFNCNTDDDDASTNASSMSKSTSTALSEPPIIFAIGGIDEHNCHEPVVSYGADGVATIRTVMQASDPRGVVLSMNRIMQSTKMTM